MKKLLYTLAFLFILAIGLMSCRSSKPPCPAYPMTQNTAQVDNNIAR